MTHELAPFDGGLQVLTRMSVFDRKNVQTRIVKFAYQSIEDIALEVLPSHGAFICSICGEVIPRDQWKVTFVSPNDSLVFTPELQGGNTNWGKAIVGAILVVIAIVITILSYGSIAGWSIDMAYTGVAMMTAAFTGAVGASLLATAFLPVGKTPEQSESLTSWSPSTTQKQGGAIPRYYGRHKVVGNLIATNIVNSGNIQYMYALICLGIGPYVGISNIKINKIRQADLSDATITSRMGYLAQAVLPGFQDTTTNYADSQLMTYNTPVVRTTTGDAFDKLTIKMLFPAGLAYFYKDGDIGVYGVTIKVEVRGPNDAVWHTIPASQTAITSQKATWCGWSLGYWVTTEGSFGLPGSTTWRDIKRELGTPTDHYEGEVETVKTGTVTTDGKTSDVMETGRWRWVEEYVPATTVVDYITINGATRNRVPVDMDFYVPAGCKGQYDFRVTRLSADVEHERLLEDIYYVGYAETIYDDLTYPRHALVSIVAKSTGQLNGTVDFSCILDGAYVRVYDSATETWSIAWSDNQAWIAYDILTSPLFDDALTTVLRYDGENPSRLNLDSFVAFAAWCDASQPSLEPQSIVTGTDSNLYKCIATHTATAATQPPTGLTRNIIPLMYSATGPSGTVAASSTEIEGYEPWCCLNQQSASGSRWKGAIEAPATEVTLSYTFTEAKLISAYTVRWFPTYYATGWVLEGYDTDTSSWVALHTVTGFSYAPVLPADAYDATYLMSHSTLYAAYRVRVTGANAEGKVWLFKWELCEAGTDWQSYWELTTTGTPVTWTLGDKYYSGTEKRYQFNGGIDERMSRWEAALKVCSTAQATLLRIGTEIRVIIDKVRTPTQLFSEGNVISHNEKWMNLTNRATEIEVDFTNEENDYQREKLVAYQSNSPTTFGTFNLSAFGLTKRSQAWRLAKHHAIQNQRRHVLEIEVDIDAISCMVGDTVYYQAEMCDWGDERGGNVMSATINTVTIDKSFPATSGTTYSVAIRLSDDTIVIKELAAMSDGSYSTLTLKSGTWGDTLPAFGDPYVVGELAKMIDTYAVTGITPNKDHGATITMIEYDSTWYASTESVVPAIDNIPVVTVEHIDVDEITPAAWSGSTAYLPGNIVVESNIYYTCIKATTNNQPPNATYWMVTEDPYYDITLQERTQFDKSGAFSRVIDVTWTLDSTSLTFQKARIYYREYDATLYEAQVPWTLAGEATDLRFTVPHVKDSQAYQIGISCVDTLGTANPTIAYAFITTAATTVGIDPPDNIADLQVRDNATNGNFTGPDCSVVWTALPTTGTSDDADNVGGAPVKYDVSIKSNDLGTTHRTTRVSLPEFTYTLAQNIADGAGVTFTVSVVGVDAWGVSSATPTTLVVTNTIPAAVTGLAVDGIVGGVAFTWARSTAEDFAVYEYRDKIGNDAEFGSWIETHDNSVTRVLTDAEIADHGVNATVYVEVRVKDAYGQTSDEASGNAKANRLADSIFQITALDSGGSSDVSKLLDGDIATNALLIE